MSIAPFLQASAVVQIHLVAAIAALVLGALVLWRRKGTALHRNLGKVWVLLMGLVAVSSIFISEIQTWGRFSPVHLLTVFTLISLPLAILHARRGVIFRHKMMMQGLYIGGLVIAGLFALAPGRLAHRILFGHGFSPEAMGSNVWILSLASAVALFAVIYWRVRTREARNQG